MTASVMAGFRVAAGDRSGRRHAPPRAIRQGRRSRAALQRGKARARTRLPRLFDLGFGPQIQVYFLVAFWCLAAAAPMYGITRTPLGCMCNAVRDIAARVPYAGAAGGPAAINFEIADPAYFGAAQPGNALLATFVGAGHFAGPVAGAILVTCLQTLLGDVTVVWQLYFGLMFMAAVMYLPGGIASLWTVQIPLWRAGRLARVEFPVSGSASTADWSIIGDRNKLDLRRAHLGPYTYPVASDLLARDKVTSEGIATQRCALADFDAALEFSARPEAVKVLLLPAVVA